MIVSPYLSNCWWCLYCCDLYRYSTLGVCFSKTVASIFCSSHPCFHPLFGFTLGGATFQNRGIISWEGLTSLLCPAPNDMAKAEAQSGASTGVLVYNLTCAHCEDLHYLLTHYNLCKRHKNPNKLDLCYKVSKKAKAQQIITDSQLV